MARHKDVAWSLPVGTPNGSGSHTHQWESIQVALLMDIRDELQALNAVFRCPNFMEIPRTLRTIRANTSKPKRRKPRIAS